MIGDLGQMPAAPGLFATELRAMMASRGLSQRQLAMRSGINHSTISRILTARNEPTLDTAIRIARACRQWAP